MSFYKLASAIGDMINTTRARRSNEAAALSALGLVMNARQGYTSRSAPSLQDYFGGIENLSQEYPSLLEESNLDKLKTLRIPPGGFEFAAQEAARVQRQAAAEAARGALFSAADDMEIPESTTRFNLGKGLGVAGATVAGLYGLKKLKDYVGNLPVKQTVINAGGPAGLTPLQLEMYKKRMGELSEQDKKIYDDLLINYGPEAADAAVLGTL